MGFFVSIRSHENEKINEFVVNKYSADSDLETTVSFKEELKNGLENRFINPLVRKNNDDIFEH